MQLVWIGFGSAVGGVLRYLLASGVVRLGAPTYAGTLTVNVLGSFFISVIMYMSLATSLIGPELRLALTTGLLGGFTTYSAFTYDTLALLQRGQLTTAVWNVALTVVLSLAAGGLGLWVARAAVAR